MQQALPPEDEGIVERRTRQRFVATRRGQHCFWAVLDGVRYPLLDLSVAGFAVAPPQLPPIGALLSFTLLREGVPDQIAGAARVMNHVTGQAGCQAGCRFEALPEDDLARLQDWLTAHVLMSASVPISERDALRIVSGPPLI